MRYLLIITLAFFSFCFPVTLKEVFDSSHPEGGYDKVLRLEKGRLYTGGLMLGFYYNPIIREYEPLKDNLNIKIEGNGAIIDLENSQIHMNFSRMKLDIDSCVVMNGTLRYTGNPSLYGEGYDVPYGEVRNVTFYNSIDYGIRMERSGKASKVMKNLVVNTRGTGSDFDMYYGIPRNSVRTGTAFSFSYFPWYGTVEVGHENYFHLAENWTYTDKIPDEPLDHFSLL